MEKVSLNFLLENENASTIWIALLLLVSSSVTILLKNLLYYVRAEGTLKQSPFIVFYDGQTTTYGLILHTNCSTEVSNSRWYRELTLKFLEMYHWTQKLWTNDFLKLPNPFTEQAYQLTFYSFPDHLHRESLYILLQSFCTIAALCCHSWKFPHTHYSFIGKYQLHCTPTHQEIMLTVWA